MEDYFKKSLLFCLELTMRNPSFSVIIFEVLFEQCIIVDCDTCGQSGINVPRLKVLIKSILAGMPELCKNYFHQLLRASVFGSLNAQTNGQDTR